MDNSVYEYMWWDSKWFVHYRRKGYKKSRNMNRSFHLWLYRNAFMIGKPDRETKQYANFNKGV